MEDRCICCGEIIPEGRQVCWACERGEVNNGNNRMCISCNCGSRKIRDRSNGDQGQGDREEI